MKKIIYSGCILILIGIVGSIVSFVVKNPFQTTNINKKEIVSGNGVNNIEVVSSSTDVKVEPSHQKDITIKLDGHVSKNMKDQFQLNIEKNDGTINIEIKRKQYFNISLMAFSKTKLLVSIPENIYQSISIMTSSGDIVAKGLHVEHLSVKSSSGDIQIGNGIVENQMTVQSSSGDINTNEQDSKIASVSSSSGDIRLNHISGIINAKAVSGDINIHPNDKMKEISVETTSGDVKVKVQTEQRELPLDINFKGNSGDGKVKLKGVQYSVNSDHIIVGKISTGAIKLKVRTSSGDFVLE